MPLCVSRDNRRLSARLRLAGALAAGCAAIALGGCGGGGGSQNPNPNSVGSYSTVSGTITDVNGNPIVGATVSLAGQTTTSTQGGDYQFASIPVPSGQNSVLDTLAASKTVSGRPWSGQNTLEVLYQEPNTSNANVVMSDSGAQGAVSGTVLDQGGNPLAGARVFAAPGPVSSSGSTYFTNLSSFNVYTNQNGQYTLSKLPVLSGGVTYTVTASFVGYINSTQTGVNVSAGAATRLNFTLDASSNSPALPAVTGFSASTFTVPATPSRASGTAMAAVYAAIRDMVLKQHGLSGHRFAEPSRVTLHYGERRSSPPGWLIETDLFWNYQQLDNLYGYDVGRSPDSVNWTSVATLRDPLGDRFSDLDPILTPDTVYYYSVARLDTINFPQTPSNSSSNGPAASPVQVDPLGPLTLASPASGAPTTPTPTLAWNAVNGAIQYSVYVYNQFPDYQVSSLTPVVSQVVTAPSTSLTVTSPLGAGVYYWFVIAQYQPPTNRPDLGAGYSISQIGNFTAQ